MDDTGANSLPDRSPVAIEPDPVSLESEQLSSEGRLRRALNTGKYAVKSAVVAVELLPVTNEGIRYGALAATELATHNPAVGAAVLGGSTLLIEGAGAMAASDLITRPTSNRLLSWLNDKLEKVVPVDTELSKTAEAGVAMTLGTPILMAAKQRENPERTSEEAKKQGLLTAAWMAGVFAVEGALISKGVDNYTDPKMVGAALLAVGATLALPKWARRALNRDQEKSITKRIGRVESVMSGGGLDEQRLSEATETYETFRDIRDESVKVGLYGRICAKRS